MGTARVRVLGRRLGRPRKITGVKIEATMRGMSLAEVPEWARRAEDVGFDGIWTTETNNDGFFPLLLAAEHTRRVELGTGIALAFSRSPLHLAHAAWDLNLLAEGRFILGLGSQVRAHVERRFSSDYSRPVARMRDLMLAIRAIWKAWDEGGELDYQGTFYRHTLMPPAFRPPASAAGPPRIGLAAVRERMTEVAGEVADVFLGHPLQTERFLREFTIPALERGLERSGRSRDALEVGLALFTVTNDEERESVRRRVAFYASTPQYRHLLTMHGWDDLGEQLHDLSRTGGWSDMPGVIADEVLETIAVCGDDADEVAVKTLERYGGLVDRIGLHAGELSSLEQWAELPAAFGRQLAVRT